MEFQAKQLFAKHDVPVTLGIVVETAEERGSRSRGARRRGRGQGTGQGRRPRQGRRRQAREDPRRGLRARRAILGMEIKGLTVHRVLITPAAPPWRSTTSPSCSTASNRSYLCIASVEGGVEIEEVAKTNPDAVKQIPIDAGAGVDEAKAREIVAEAGFPAELDRPGGHHGPGAVEGLRRGGRHPGRGQPAGPPRGRHARGARRQGLARRERRVPPRGPRRVRDPRGDRPARGQGQGQGPQLRQARRCRSASSATARVW